MLSSEMVVVPLCESVSLSLIPAVFVVGVGVVAGSIDSSGVTDGDAVTVSAVGVAVAHLLSVWPLALLSPLLVYLLQSGWL